MRKTAVKSSQSAEDNLSNAVNNRLFFRLIQCGNLYERGVNQHVNISSIQGTVLGALSRGEDQSMSFADLVEYLAVSRQNLDAVLKRLERLGYVERVESPHDRRVRIVRMTPQGNAFWTDIFAQSFLFYKKITAGLTIEQKKQLTDMLITISQNIRRADHQDGLTSSSGITRRR